MSTTSAGLTSAGPVGFTWVPFRYGAFALLWTATLDLERRHLNARRRRGLADDLARPSPDLVALVQATTTFPVFLFALFAGTLADRLHKKRMLIVLNVCLLIVRGALVALAAADAVTSVGLILFTQLIGTGTAFVIPPDKR